MTSADLLVPAGELRAALPARAGQVLDELVATVAADPASLGRVFPAAARRTARGDLPGGGRVEDAVRVELIVAAASGLAAEALVEELGRAYDHGDADERRAVLLGLSALDDPDVDGSAILLDALRTNDVRLVTAAMGRHARTLSLHDWRHGVLKCLFVGAALRHVAGLADRADDELGAMVRRYVLEREAAGRSVPDDAHLVLRLTDPTISRKG